MIMCMNQYYLTSDNYSIKLRAIYWFVTVTLSLVSISKKQNKIKHQKNQIQINLTKHHINSKSHKSKKIRLIQDKVLILIYYLTLSPLKTLRMVPQIKRKARILVTITKNHRLKHKRKYQHKKKIQKSEAILIF